MPIMLTPETEARLREKAIRDGQDVDTVAEAMLKYALEWEAQERDELIEAVRQSDQASAEGRERPFSEFVAEQRAKHGFAVNWPHATSENQDTDHV